MSSATEWLEERTKVMEAAQAMYRQGLVVAASGNVSVRVRHDGRDLMAITASGKDYERLTIDRVVVVDLDGEPVHGDALPSTESLMHGAVYKTRKDVGAVMHTHSTYASSLAVAGMPLPPLIDEMVIALGDSIQVARYAFPGTEELGVNVVEALGERNAVLLKNHGLVGVGHTMDDALKVCALAERLCQVYVTARLLGRADPLPADAVAAEVELYRMRQFGPGEGGAR
ncbi:MAG: class II aldolase/adducin family protein [SAR202 cluster bacterium]|nr:class II aldolase/adducin family protein [SAR202 cluster bacterium]